MEENIELGVVPQTENLNRIDTCLESTNVQYVLSTFKGLQFYLEFFATFQFLKSFNTS